MAETAWDRELVLVQLGLLADIRTNTQRIQEIMEGQAGDDDGEETQED